ncbi:MAG: alkaline phosphatase family protein [Saprospirales bacterium]|nr:MAG: alkaline phosphatase family protein [Saprospirales bacterium]
MKRNLLILTTCMSIILLQACGSSNEEVIQTSRQYTVILSLDGFRWDYADHTPTPHLDYIARKGVKAESLIPVFPSGTFANHYSMATGLHPDNHGIVANRFSCPILQRDYNKGDRSTVREGMFYSGEPIWVTANKHGLRTAAFYWVGSEADVMGIRPDIWKKYSNDFPYGDRVDSVAHWLSLPEPDRPDLIMWYYHQIDSDGHRYGPLADSLLMTVRMKDSLIGVFLNKIDDLPYRDQINFIVVSDHGMTEINRDEIIYLDLLVDTSLIELIDGGGAIMNIKARKGKKEELYHSLKAIDKLSVWKSGEVPERFHYGTHPRTHDIVVLADLGYLIGWSSRNYTFIGAHNYDNFEPDMHGIFYAMGPAFERGVVLESFQNISIYPLLSYLLGIEPARNDAELYPLEAGLLLKNNKKTDNE